jgi:hypothetical protein
MRQYYLYGIRLPGEHGYSYFGITGQSQPQARFSQHADADTLIGHAIRHYGSHNCLVEILSAGPEFDIRDQEGRTIRFFNTRYPAGYNYAPRPSDAEARSWLLDNLNDSSQDDLNNVSGLDAIIAPAMSLEKRPNCGWIEIRASSEGMRAIERVFPGWAFNWERLRSPWKGWWSTVSHVPRLAAACALSVRSELIGLTRLQALNDEQLACLIAQVAYDEGVRAAWRPGCKGVHPFFRKIHAAPQGPKAGALC